MRKIKRGTRKYKGKIPFKCFECGRIGHYASKCPYEKVNNSDDEVKFKSNDHKRRQNIKNKILHKMIVSMKVMKAYQKWKRRDIIHGYK